jgi:arginine exporter protein ArgO
LYSSKFIDLTDRFYFGVGAAAFSTFWFFGLAILASGASRFLNNPNAMKIVSLLSGIILILLGLKLGADVSTWIKEVL